MNPAIRITDMDKPFNINMMKKILLTLSTIAVMAGCNMKQAGEVPAIDRANFDETASINDDFYQYATGG